ncbi:MAG: LysR family transcriptional regulator [Candidatus Accumulibacter sp.]|jgi:DNA-binding transcriptional LysR family regulator|nr:LysR family transcriptional regulator [Accumulibacter sp.]
MFTFKQLESIYWIVEAGGFAQAARKLHTTQSAVSKRVRELENLFGIALFERSHRAAQLTEKGETMFVLAKRLLDQRQMAVDQIGRPEGFACRLRLGITELTAMTWLPRLYGKMQENFPNLIIEPSVKNSVDLKDDLLEDELDFIIVPDAFRDVHLSSVPVGKVRNSWMCKPGTFQKKGKRLAVSEFASQQLLTQDDRSGTGLIYKEWWVRKMGVPPKSSIACSSLLAMLGMTVAGLGISYLPRDCLSEMMRSGLLEEIESSPPLPEITYVAMHPWERKIPLIPSIAALARECCDFSRMFGVAAPAKERRKCRKRPENQ